MSTPTPAAPAAPSGAPQPPAPSGNDPAPQNPPAPQQQPPTAPQTDPQDVASLPDWAQKLIRDTRAEAADYRTRYQQAQQQPQQPAPQTPPTPPVADVPEGAVERLPKWAQQAITESAAAARRAAVQAAVIQAAPTAGADVARLLDSASFNAAVAQIDPADTTAVTEAIKNAVTAQPWLAATPSGPPRGGADFGQTGAREVTPEQFARMSYAERTELYQTDPDTYRRLAGA
ncbi:hypothetical protein [Streptomyces sp. enrichment culture]|uniref:hypothetical protein n=1 Tax=Streptomyces sp. enrichment culture TaxID=1795815 RepID=UPI003F568C5E